MRDAEPGKQRVDKLFRVVRRDEAEEWLLVHVEIQSQPDRLLPERMYHYHHRVADRYQRRVVSLAVLADPSPDFSFSAFDSAKPDPPVIWKIRLRFSLSVLRGYRHRNLARTTSARPTRASPHVAHRFIQRAVVA